MALTDDSGMVMPVGPMYGNGFSGGFGGDIGWLILILLCCNGGWGGFGGFGGGVGGFAADGAMLYPWMNQSQQVNDGFRDQMLNSTVTGIQSAVTSGFGDVQMALCNGFAGVEQGANARQMADMQQMFSLQQQLSQCCCDNRLATCQTQNIVQSEGSATRFADANNTRDIVESQTRNTQAILDKLCALELDGYKRENDNLRSQLNMATLRESQTAQNAFIAQGFSDEVDQLYNRLSNCPVPSTPVYGRTPIFTCNGNNGCGCNGNTFIN
jgi:hypothetical protein